MSYNIPNILTISRMVVIPFLIFFLLIESRIANIIAVVIFSIAGFTDYLDGFLARKHGISSDFGRVFDPISDKLLVAVAMILLIHLYDNLIVLICGIIILAREILISGLREYASNNNIVISVSKLAKWKTGFQMVAIGFLIAGVTDDHFIESIIQIIGHILLLIATILTIATGSDYLKGFFKN